MEIHDNIDWPEVVTFAGLNAWQVNPLGRGLAERVTEPLKPPRGLIAMMETATVVPSAIADAGVAVIVKSGMGLVWVAITPVSLVSAQLLPATGEVTVWTDVGMYAPRVKMIAARRTPLPIGDRWEVDRLRILLCGKVEALVFRLGFSFAMVSRGALFCVRLMYTAYCMIGAALAQEARQGL